MVTGQARKAIMPCEACNCLTTDEILYNTIQHTDQHIPIYHSNSSHERDAKLRGKTEMKALIGLLHLVEALWSNMLSLEELRSTDTDGVEKF